MRESKQDMEVQLSPVVWRKKVRGRANGKCEQCGKRPRGYLHCHHVDGDNRNNTLENGIALCTECHNLTHGLLVEEGEDLRKAVGDFHQTQKIRIAIANQIKAQGMPPNPPWFAGIRELEKNREGQMLQEAKRHVAYKPIMKLKGFGPLYTAQLLGFVRNFGRFANPSKLWAYAGLKPNSGKKEGQDYRYNHTLKAVCLGRIGSGLMRNSPYKVVYDDAKAHYEKTHPEWTNNHRHMAAKRKMVKICLSHIWEIGRLAEGLDIVPPWILEQQGHSKVYRREDFM